MPIAFRSEMNRRRVIALAAGALTATIAADVAAEEADGAISITVDDSLGAAFGPAEVYVDGEPRGVAEAGCCMMIRAPRGQRVLTLRWPDHEIRAEFELKGGLPASFHVTAQRVLQRLDD